MKSYRILILGIACCLVACGRYASPVPPEALSSQAVQNLQIVPTLQGVAFSWEAADDDQQGKELKSMDGYRIYRRLQSDLMPSGSPEEKFTLLATIPDTHIKERDRLREDAKQKNIPSHRINAPAELEKFTYADNGLVPGETYLYRVVPLNQDDVEGQVTQVARVLFRGTSSEIEFIPEDSFEDALLGSAEAE